MATVKWADYTLSFLRQASKSAGWSRQFLHGAFYYIRFQLSLSLCLIWTRSCTSRPRRLLRAVFPYVPVGMRTLSHYIIIGSGERGGLLRPPHEVKLSEKSAPSYISSKHWGLGSVLLHKVFFNKGVPDRNDLILIYSHRKKKYMI